MGLGKTLQTLLILVSCYQDINQNTLPSLVICPSTVTWHWKYEIDKFFGKDNKYLKPIVIHGKPNERAKQYAKLKQNNTNQILIVSYNIAKNDIKRLTKYKYNYCILDEGHLIKNPKSN